MFKRGKKNANGLILPKCMHMKSSVP